MAISAVIFGCAFAACWPGGVSYDASNQWRQAHSGELNNWHPVFHTLLIWLVTRVGQLSLRGMRVQIAAFSVASGVSDLHAAPRRAAWLALTAHTLVCASLPVRNTLMFLGDSAMTAAVLVLTAQAVNLLHTRGGWLRHPRNAVAFRPDTGRGHAVAPQCHSMDAPLGWRAAFCAFHGTQRGAALAAGAAALALVLVRGPLYGALTIHPDNTTEESVASP